MNYPGRGINNQEHDSSIRTAPRGRQSGHDHHDAGGYLGHQEHAVFTGPAHELSARDRGSGVARRSGEPIARTRAVRVLLLGTQEEIWVWYIGVVEGPRER